MREVSTPLAVGGSLHAPAHSLSYRSQIFLLRGLSRSRRYHLLLPSTSGWAEVSVLKEKPRSLTPESFPSNHYHQETHKKQPRFHNRKTSLFTSSPPSLEKFPSLISEDALLTRFFSFLSPRFYPPPPLITSYAYSVSSLTLKQTQPQTVSRNCFISAHVSPQTPGHSAATPDTAQMLQTSTSISGAVWDPALTPTVMTEISWPLLRSVLLVAVLEAAWYRWAQQQHSHVK